MTPEQIAICSIIVSFIGLVINFLTYRHKMSESEQQAWQDQIDGLIETNNRLANRFTKLSTQHNNLHIELEVVKERLRNEITLLQKLEDKLDDISEKLK